MKREAILEVGETQGTGPEPQRTLRRSASFTGVGLHTGQETTFTFRPAPPGTGIRFVRTDLPGGPEIQVCPENARLDAGTMRRTILRAGEAEMHTVEHVLAALAGLGIDNLFIDSSGMEAPEPPDGSARAFVELLLEAGLENQNAPREYLEVQEPVCFQENGIQIVALPHEGFRVSFTIQYDNQLVGTQHASFEIDPETFARQIAPARTFALWEDVEKLRQAGMIRGGTLQNAIVVREGEILSQEGLRFEDEFVRHKVLDLMGDLCLLGRPLRGHILSVRSGHGSNVRFVKKLSEHFEAPGEFESMLDRVHMDIAAIQAIMPHRYPILLVDRILLLEEGRRVVGLKNVTINEPFFVGHFPGHPIMPAVLILEAMAQAGGVLLLNSVERPETKLVYFIGIDRAKFRKPVTPGDQLIFDLEMVRFGGRICKMNGRAFVRKNLVAEAELTSTIVDR